MFDDASRHHLLPFTYTRPVAEIRFGILTIREKWEKTFSTQASFLTDDYLRKKFPLHTESENMLVNGSLCPDTDLKKAMEQLQTGQALVQNGLILAAKLEEKNISAFPDQVSLEQVTYEKKILKINFMQDIFHLNDLALNEDFKMLTAGRKSAVLSKTNMAIAPENIFIEEGAIVECSIINASTGPVYIGHGAEIMEGCKIRGPFALCDHATLKMDAKIYGATTIGPYCKVGGEINNSVLFAYSSKAHDGFLGNSVIGEWCNLGADTNNSNLKNNYAEVKLWNYNKGSFQKTGLQFCGLMMGDHSKCGINTMFNTGTVVGVSANIFGSGFPRNFVPDFAWGGAAGFEVFSITKAYEVAEKVFARRNKVFDDIEKEILAEVFEKTNSFRNF